MTHHENVLTFSRTYKSAAYFCSHLYVENMLLQISEQLVSSHLFGFSVLCIFSQIMMMQSQYWV